MANAEIRDSRFTCPQCGLTLKENWAYKEIGSLQGGKEWQPVGKAYCSDGHRFEWSLAGPL